MPYVKIVEKDLTTGLATAEKENIFVIIDSGVTSEEPIIYKYGDTLPEGLTKESVINKILTLGGKVCLVKTLTGEDNVAVKYLKDRNQFNIKFICVEQAINGEEDATTSSGELAGAISIVKKRRDVSIIYTKILREYSSAEIELLASEMGGSDGFLEKEAKSYVGKYVLPYCAKDLTSEGKEVNAGDAYAYTYLNNVNHNMSPYLSFAGYKYGVVPLTNLKVGYLTEDEIDELQPEKTTSGKTVISINPIVDLQCLGSNTIRIVGDRTALPLPTAEGDVKVVASSFASNRIVLNDIKKRMYMASRRYQFETLDNTLYINFTSYVNELLDTIKGVGKLNWYRWEEQETDSKTELCLNLTISLGYPFENAKLTVSISDDLTVEENN